MSKRHEQLLFRYSSALERGDFQSVADVLREAERDPALEQMILDMNDVYSAERFNHTNPKEIPMIAALYQNPKRMPRYRWQGLPFVAALAVIALLSVMLAIQTRGSIPVNSGGNDSPAAQISPYCTGTLISTFTVVPLYSRPSSDAPVVTELQYTNNAGREIVVLDVTSVDGETWVFVRVPSSPDVPFGWMTEAQFRTMVADCQPTLVPVEAVVQPTIVPPVATGTPVPGVQQHPLLVATLPSDSAFVTVIPADVQPLSTFTATPVPLLIEPSPLPPTVVPPDAAEQGISAAATDLAHFGEGGFCKMITLTTAGVRVFPKWDSPVITTLPEGTFVTVGDFVSSTDAQGNPLRWFVVGYEDIRGWMPASQLDTSACPFSEAPTASQPTLVPPAQDVAASGEQFMPVYVQPGDTLISVLRRFNINLDRIPELMRINDLTDNGFVTGSAELSPGTILLLPVPNLGSLLTCTLHDGEQVDVLTEDAEDAEVVMTLQAGDSLDVFTEPIADWYAAVVHYDSATMSSVYVRVDAIESLTDCQPVAAAEVSPTIVAAGAEPACSTSIGERLVPVTVYAQPGRDALVVAEMSGVDPNAVIRLDTTSHAGEVWVYVRVGSASATQTQGWITLAQFDSHVTCALIQRSEQPTVPPPTVPPPVQVITATPIPTPTPIQ